MEGLKRDSLMGLLCSHSLDPPGGLVLRSQQLFHGAYSRERSHGGQRVGSVFSASGCYKRSVYNRREGASYLLFGERILGQVDGLQARLNKGKPDLDAAAFLGIEPGVSPGGLIR